MEKYFDLTSSPAHFLVTGGRRKFLLKMQSKRDNVPKEFTSVTSFLRKVLRNSCSKKFCNFLCKCRQSSEAATRGVL